MLLNVSKVALVAKSASSTVTCFDALQMRGMFATAVGSTMSLEEPIWGWLEPKSPSLPYVLLHDCEVALGRGLVPQANSKQTASPLQGEGSMASGSGSHWATEAIAAG